MQIESLFSKEKIKEIYEVILSFEERDILSSALLSSLVKVTPKTVGHMGKTIKRCLSSISLILQDTIPLETYRDS